MIVSSTGIYAQIQRIVLEITAPKFFWYLVGAPIFHHREKPFKISALSVCSAVKRVSTPLNPEEPVFYGQTQGWNETFGTSLK
jgi:hypothetical protein